jgi:hypothetical protein
MSLQRIMISLVATLVPLTSAASIIVGRSELGSLVTRAPAFCFNPETDRLVCYSEAGATPQNVTVQDMTYFAALMRHRAETEGPWLKMEGADADNCAEWSLSSKGSGLLLSKHTTGDDPTWVLLADVANTIDGGQGDGDLPSWEVDVKDSIMGCGTAGGQRAVKVNKDNELYKSDEFVKSGASSKGVLIKIVGRPSPAT